MAQFCAAPGGGPVGQNGKGNTCLKLFIETRTSMKLSKKTRQRRFVAHPRGGRMSFDEEAKKLIPLVVLASRDHVFVLFCLFATVFKIMLNHANVVVLTPFPRILIGIRTC